MSDLISADFDWIQKWREMRKKRGIVDDPALWDKRALTFGCAKFGSPYITAFINKLELRPRDSVFDMGCGNGGLAIPLALKGHEVIARDFSTGMLKELEKGARELEVFDKIDYARLSWEDDWESAGITPGMVDVAFASRSVITNDLGASLLKLTSVARRYACATISTGFIPAISPTIMQDLGMKMKPSCELQYTFNILCQLGYLPSVSYIVSDRKIAFEENEEAEEQIYEMIDRVSQTNECEGVEEARLHVAEWVQDHAAPNEDEGKQSRHHECEGSKKILIPNDVRWAFFKWDV